MVGCGKECTTVYPTLDTTFFWVYLGDPSECTELGGFSDNHNKYSCGDWYEKKKFWQLICLRCMQKEGIIW